jgi:hypothetical protein
MSRARELAKLGGAGQQVVAGVSSFVGVSTFASDVFMLEDLSVVGNLNVTGDLSYDETTATNSNILGVSTTKDLVVTQNAVVTGIVTVGTDKVVIGAGVTDLLVRGNARVTGILTIGNSSATLSDTGMVVGSSNLHSTGVETLQVNASGLNATGIVTANRFDGRLTGNINASGVSTAAFLQATTVNVSAGATVGGNLVVTGDLTVNGTTVTIKSTTLTVDDKNIELGSVTTPTDVTADGGGITLKGATDKTINWISSASAWTSSEDFNLVTGKVYEINGTSVLSSTTLGSSVVNSSLTSVGTLGNLTVSGGITGRLNSSGVSTITQLVATTVNASGIVTASSFSGAGSGITALPITGITSSTTIGLGVGAIELGHASDTSITRSAAGTVQIEGVTVATASNTLTLTNKTIGAATISGNLVPNANNTIDLGSSANRWANVYSNDLDLSNEGGANSIDGTWGSYLVQEGEEHLYIINRRSGKKFRFVLEEV